MALKQLVKAPFLLAKQATEDGSLNMLNTFLIS